MTLSKAALSLVLAAAMASSAMMSSNAATAAPFSAPMIQQSADAGEVQQVWYRGGWGHGWGWGGPAILGGLFIGGVIVAAAINEHRATESALRRCDRDFPGFDYRRGTYVNRYGDVRVCPYLY